MATRKKPVKSTVSADDIILKTEKEYNPNNFNTFMDAIKSGCLTEHAGRIEKYMEFKDCERLGQTVMKAVLDKVQEWETSELAHRYNSALGGGDEQD